MWYPIDLVCFIEIQLDWEKTWKVVSFVNFFSYIFHPNNKFSLKKKITLLSSPFLLKQKDCRSSENGIDIWLIIRSIFTERKDFCSNETIFTQVKKNILIFFLFSYCVMIFVNLWWMFIYIYICMYIYSLNIWSPVSIWCVKWVVNQVKVWSRHIVLRCWWFINFGTSWKGW